MEEQDRQDSERAQAVNVAAVGPGHARAYLFCLSMHGAGLRPKP
ncbi:hypothetical protein IL54_2844 [Sphingobium sp. ba1]|nr:hypothetical protein IL54_2844 [Sphingobium sp. ba1]